MHILALYFISKNFFNLIMIHGYVPNDFGYCIVVPLLKDRYGDVSKLDNCRAITISCVISKVLRYSHPLLFGFKKGIWCQNAIFAMQQTVKYFTERGSTVFCLHCGCKQSF